MSFAIPVAELATRASAKAVALASSQHKRIALSARDRRYTEAQEPIDDARMRAA